MKRWHEEVPLMENRSRTKRDRCSRENRFLRKNDCEGCEHTKGIGLFRKVRPGHSCLGHMGEKKNKKRQNRNRNFLIQQFEDFGFQDVRIRGARKKRILGKEYCRNKSKRTIHDFCLFFCYGNYMAAFCKSCNKKKVLSYFLIDPKKRICKRRIVESLIHKAKKHEPHEATQEDLIDREEVKKIQEESFLSELFWP